MQVSNWIVFSTVEVMALLLIVCIFLLFHARKLKGITGKLQDKLRQVILELKQSRQRCKELEEASSAAGSSYGEMIDQQIGLTRDYHASLGPDRDIALDLDREVPIQRQVASLRHAFLISEKEASLASDEPGKPQWEILQSRLKNLLSFFRPNTQQKSPAAEDSGVQAKLQEALAERDQRIANLEKFRTLFFELEDRWDAAQQEARNYHDQLQGFDVGGTANQAEFDQILQRYRDTYESFGAELATTASDAPRKATVLTQVVEAPGSGPHPSHELNQLKAVAANQHQLITELQQRLARAYSAQEKEALIQELQQQLETHLRYLKESETCIELMENELNQANRQIDDLEAEIHRLDLREQQNVKLIKAARLLKEERGAMDHAIKKMQLENQQLESQLQMLMSSAGNDAGTSAIQQELKQLQQRYLDLENKYLDLRMKAQ